MTGRPNVIFVVLDTVRADRVSALGYERETTPNLDDFAARGTTFTDAVAHAPWSIPSHAALFTGEYPRSHGWTAAKPILADGPTLPELLSEGGYGTYAFSTNEYIRPVTGFARGFDEFHTSARVTEPPILADVLAPAVNRFSCIPTVRRPIERAFTTLQERGSTTTEPALPTEDGFLDTTAGILERADDPFFFFVNLTDVHLPRSPAPEHVEEFVDPDLSAVPIVENERSHTIGDAELDDRGFRKMSHLYDADLRTLDERFGALVGLLDETGVLSDSLVVAVSDHGEHLGEFDRVGHQFSVFDSVVSVPLVIQFPDGSPGRVDEQVEIRRLFDTVLDEAGLRPAGERSLASGVGDDVAHGSYHSPMVDIAALLFDDVVRYDPELLGEPLAFARTPDSKLVTFDGEEWLFDVPEDGQSVIPKPEAPDTYERLSALAFDSSPD